MASARHVIVAGGGIAGLTAALALARCGLRATVLEQSPVLQETGAGIQLSPNATRVLIALGLDRWLAPSVMTPAAIRVMSGGSGREIALIPLGSTAERRYGAPYWTVHRGDLQAALVAAAQATPDVDIKLDVRVEEFAAHPNGVSVLGRRTKMMIEERGIALVGADGIWSAVRTRLRPRRPPRFAHRTAWRALVPADRVPAEFREPVVHLWLGLDAHLVHYPVKNGRLINIVGIGYDEWNKEGWSAPGEPKEIARRFARFTWHDRARALIGLPEQWLKWALFDGHAPPEGSGPVTLIGDAAHPMLPFLAQGAGMAIEDAAVLADALSAHAGNPAEAFRRYERMRRQRTARVQQMSRKQGRVYGLSGPEAFIRNMGMRLLGGERLLARQDWLYSWRPPERFSS